MTRDPSTHSVSALMVYEACPYQYYRTYIAGIAPPITPAMRSGTNVHALIASQFGQLELFPPELDPTTQGLLDAFRRSRFNRPPIAVERAFNLSIGGDTVRGRMDLLLPRADGGLEIVDFKSGRSGGPRRRRDFVGSLQLPLYSLAASRDASLASSSVTCTYFFLRDETEVSFRADASLLAATEARVSRILEAVHAGRFEPRPRCDCFACRELLLDRGGGGGQARPWRGRAPGMGSSASS